MLTTFQERKSHDQAGGNDALATAVSATPPGLFNVASKTISSLIEITGSVDDDEEIYCPENFCQRSKKRDPGFHGPRSAYVNASEKIPRMFACQQYGLQKRCKKRTALLNSGMHRQVCAVMELEENPRNRKYTAY